MVGQLDKYIGPLVDMIGMSVEALVYTPEEFQQMQDRSFIKRALKEGVVIYEH